MKLIKRIFKPYGLRARFSISLAVSVLLCGLLFFILYNVSDRFLTGFFEQSAFLESNIRKQAENLQDYVDDNSISSNDLQQLKNWEYRQPLILLELYSDERCIYSSFYEDGESRYHYEAAADNKDHTFSIKLTDKEVTAVLYSDFTYKYYVLSTVISLLISFVLFVLLFLHSNRRLIRYICRLNEEVQILEGGNLEYQVSVEGNDEITDLAKSMNRMRESFQQQIQTEQALHQANRRLVTEMSHDLRTPLTGMMLYLEILRSHRYTSDKELQDYLDKIDIKARNMKQISDHLFEYSLDETRQKKTALQAMEKAFKNVTDSFMDDLNAHGFNVVSQISWTPCFVEVNDEFIKRIFENVVSNAVKYAEPGTEITICSIESDQYCGFSILNTYSASDGHIESNGIGIESIRSMMKQMNGICTVEQTETAFEISLLFPKH